MRSHNVNWYAVGIVGLLLVIGGLLLWRHLQRWLPSQQVVATAPSPAYPEREALTITEPQKAAIWKAVRFWLITGPYREDYPASLALPEYDAPDISFALVIGAQNGIEVSGWGLRESLSSDPTGQIADRCVADVSKGSCPSWIKLGDLREVQFVVFVWEDKAGQLRFEMTRKTW